MLVVRQTNDTDYKLALDVFGFYLGISSTTALISKDYEEIEKAVLSGSSFVSLLDNVVVGFVTFREWEDFVEPMTLIVSPDCRRQGIGSQLMSKMIDFFRRRFPKKTITVFANEKSISIMLENGLVQFDRSEVPDFLKGVYVTQLADPKFDSIVFAMSVDK